MKLKFFLVLGILLLLLLPAQQLLASSPAPGQQVNSQLDALDFSKVEKFIEEMDQETNQYLPQLNLIDLLKDFAKGDINFDLTAIFSGLIKFFFRELVANSKLLGTLVILAVICAVLENLQKGFEKGTTGKIASAVSFLVIIILAINSFTIAVNIGRETIGNMIDFINALIPLMLTLLTAMGGVASSKLFHPAMLAMLGTVGLLIKNLVFPLIFFSAILSILSHINKDFQVSKLAALFKNGALALQGLFLSVFLGFLTVMGIGGSVADGVAIRTAKFATGAFIPIVGGMFTDALEAIFGTSLLLKTALGLVGMVIIFMLCIFPLLKILSLVFVYKLAGALIQPMGEGEIVECLNTMGNALLMVFAAVAVVGLMFFFTVLIIVGTGNLNMAIR